MTNLIQQGAEAKIYLIENKIHKNRIPKTYRHIQLDNKIRTRRTKSEAKILAKAAKAGINVPKLFHTEKFNLQIEQIRGDRLSQTLNSYPEKKQKSTMQKFGTQTSKLHANNIIHADLTTSNAILAENKLFLIDFGLSYVSTKIEDKAVDIHLIKQALQAKHHKNADELFSQFLKTYKNKEVIERLAIVEKRGRYKR